MAQQWYVPFKQGLDVVAHEKNWTSIEEFLNALEFRDAPGGGGTGHHVTASGAPSAGDGEDGDVWFDITAGTVYVKEAGGWTLALDALTQTDYDILVSLIEGRVEWRNIWVQQLYQENDMVRDGAYTMIANKDTSDKAAPVPTGPLTWLLPDVPLWTDLDFIGGVFSGTRLTPPAGRFFQASSFRAWLPDVSPNAHYQVIVLDLVTGLFKATNTFDGTILPIPGWLTVPLDPVFIGDGDDFVIGLVSTNSAGTTDFNHPWVYTGTDQGGDPGTGNVTRTNQHDFIRIHKFDDDGTDRSAELASLVLDTNIRIVNEGNLNEFFEYVVTGGTDQGTYWEYQVSLLDTGLAGPPAAARCQVYFEVPIALPAEYVEDLNYWASNPNVAGYVSFDSITGGTFNDHAYGLDVQLQEFAASADWDLVAWAGNAGSSDGDGGAGPTLQQLEAWPSGPTSLEANYQVNGNILTVPAGRGVIMNSWESPEDIPAIQTIEWVEQNIDFGVVTAFHTSYVWVDAAGIVQYETAVPDPSLFRGRLYLGRAFHDPADGALSSQFRPWHAIPNQTSHTLYDLIQAIGGAFLFKGGEVDVNAAGSGPMQFGTNDQKWFSPGESWYQDRDDPNVGNNPGADPQLFNVMLSDSTQPVVNPVSVIDPSMYESPLGTYATIPNPPQRATIQRLYVTVGNSWVLSPGQMVHTNLEAAINGFASDIQNHVQPVWIEDESQVTLVAYFIMEKGTTDLSDGTNVVIIDAEGLPIGGGGGSSHTHDATYLLLSGGTMAGAINMDDGLGPHDLYNLNDPPLQQTSAVSKQWVEDTIGGTVTGHTISTTAPPSPVAGDVWVNPDEPPEGDYLPLLGGTMLGDIDMDVFDIDFASGGAIHGNNQGVSLSLGTKILGTPTAIPFVDFYQGDSVIAARIIADQAHTGANYSGGLRLNAGQVKFGITADPQRPPITFQADEDTGILRPAANQLAIALAGTQHFTFQTITDGAKMALNASVGANLFATRIGTRDVIGLDANDAVELNASGNLVVSVTSGEVVVTGRLDVNDGDDSYAYFGPNATWGGELIVGARPELVNATRAQVIVTDGNLHIDAADGNVLYLNFYNTGSKQVYISGGTQSAPGLAFHSSSDFNTGIYRYQADGLGLVGGGAVVIRGNADRMYHTSATKDPTTATSQGLRLQNLTDGRTQYITSSETKKENILDCATSLLDKRIRAVEWDSLTGDGHQIGITAEDVVAALGPDAGSYHEGELIHYEYPAVLAMLCAQVNNLQDRMAVLDA